MKKLIFGLVTSLGSISSAFAGTPSGFSTFQINWSSVAPPAATPVPTLGTYAIILLAVLLALVVFRVSRNRGLLVRALAPLAIFGTATAFMLVSESPVAGLVVPPTPPIEGDSCNGSQTYTAIAISTPPPCFVNTCGAPVTVSYSFVEAQTSDPQPVPIPEGSCTLDYFCEAIEGPPSENIAFDNSEVPSDGLEYATAYCIEIFDGAEPGPDPT